MNKSLDAQTSLPNLSPSEGLLLVDKARGKTSFSLVHLLRKTTGVKKIGHAGTLDPFATGVMILLIGKNYTRLSDQFLHQDKEYQTTLHLGVATDTFDCEGTPSVCNDKIPTLEEIEHALSHFQGKVSQVPPMFSAKKIQGKKLYELARKGITIERAPVEVNLQIKLLAYDYPLLKLHIHCSKGTYIRSIGHDLGEMLGCGAHLQELQRLRCGPFTLDECIPHEKLHDLNALQSHLRRPSVSM